MAPIHARDGSNEFVRGSGGGLASLGLFAIRHVNGTRSYISATGELYAALAFLSGRPRLAGLLLLQCCAGYLGVLTGVRHGAFSVAA